MRKIPTLFQRNYDTDSLVRDEVTPGCEWVLDGEGYATIKVDGTCCMVRGGVLYKRYDRKGKKGPKPAPGGWEPCQDEPDPNGSWPGWVPVGDGPEDRWHREAWDDCRAQMGDTTYELVGPKIGTTYRDISRHTFIHHGIICPDGGPGRSFEAIRAYLAEHPLEGVVFWHPDGRMAKIKRRDFGFPWPPKEDSR